MLFKLELITLTAIPAYAMGIKVKLTEGEKEMASPKLSRAISADFLFYSSTKIQKSLLNLIEIIDEDIAKFCTFVTG